MMQAGLHLYISHYSKAHRWSFFPLTCRMCKCDTVVFVAWGWVGWVVPLEAPLGVVVMSPRGKLALSALRFFVLPPADCHCSVLLPQNIPSGSPWCYAGEAQKHWSNHLLDPLLFWLTGAVCFGFLALWSGDLMARHGMGLLCINFVNFVKWTFTLFSFCLFIFLLFN